MADPSAPPTLLQIAAHRRDLVASMASSPDVSFSPDFVHDVRVALRRLSEITGLVEGLMPAPAAEAVGGCLRDLRQGAGELRDLDVLVEHLTHWRLPHPLGRIRAALLAAMPARREALVLRLAQELRSTSLQGALLLLGRTLDQAAPSATAAPVQDDPENQLRRALEKRIRRRRKQLRRRFGRACMKQTPEAFHEARIAAKKLRYALEVAHEAGQKGLGQELKALKHTQQLLGDMHDADVIAAVLDQKVRATRGLKGLTQAWRKWRSQIRHKQAARAREFFERSFLLAQAAAGRPTTPSI